MLVIKNAKNVNGESFDIRMEDTRICEIAPCIDVTNITCIDLHNEYFVSPGWIDLHSHCFQKYELYGDDIDTIGYQSGVTTVVDAGTAGADTIAEFYEQSKDAKSNVYAFLNIAKQGIAAQNELSDMANLDIDKISDAYKTNPDFIVGLKARMSRSVLQQSGNAPLDFARTCADNLDLPIMVHVGNEPALLEDVFARLKKHDIVTHIFNPKRNGILDDAGKVKEFVKAGHEAGIYFDLGHGSESFAFATCEKALKQGIVCDSISTDIYFRNREEGPVYSLAHTASKMLALGYPLTQVVDMITRVPAQILKKSDIGRLEVGAYADLTIFKIEKGEFIAQDALAKTMIMKEQLLPHGVVVRGEYISL